MANKKAAPAKEKKVTDKDYFDEAKSWDDLRLSEKRNQPVELGRHFGL